MLLDDHLHADVERDALYAPSTGMIACVLLQAVAGGDPGVAHLFSSDDWLVNLDPTLTRMRATHAQWQFLASMTRDERAERWAITQGRASA